MKYLGVSVVLLFALAGCSRDRGAEAAEGNRARPVNAEQTQLRDVRRQVDVVGTLAAREEAVVSAEVDGRVARLAHDLGDRVSAGEALIELDGEKLQYRAEAQRAALERHKGHEDYEDHDEVRLVCRAGRRVADRQSRRMPGIAGP